ncbi:PLDc N-terminal domain-containing protein [Propioniciclava flava]
MPRVLLVIAVIAVILYALIEAIQADGDRVRLMPRWLWIVAIVLLPGIGALGWLVRGASPATRKRWCASASDRSRRRSGLPAAPVNSCRIRRAARPGGRCRPRPLAGTVPAWTPQGGRPGCTSARMRLRYSLTEFSVM